MADNTYEDFFNLSQDMLCVVSREGELELVNPSFERVLGWAEDDLIGRSIFELVHPDDVEKTRKELAVADAGLGTLLFENRFQCADGIYLNLRWNGVPREDTGLLFAVASDTASLLESAQRFNIAIDASPAAIIMADAEGSIHLINQAAERLFGYDRDELLGQVVEKLIPSRFHTGHIKSRSGFLENAERRSMGHGRYLLGVGKHGNEFPVEIGLNPIQVADGIYVLISLVDLSVQKDLEQKLVQTAEKLRRANEQLSHLATIDELTGLLNRRGFNDQMQVHIRLMQRMGNPLSLLLVDVDHFKQLNDEFGHSVGDEYLQELGSILLQNVRVSDIAARYGGEEFAVIMPSTNPSGALMLAEKIRKAVQGYAWDQKPITVSVGASTMTFPSGESPIKKGYQSLLVSDADRALYHSKDEGRNQVTHFSDMGNDEDGDEPVPDR